MIFKMENGIIFFLIESFFDIRDFFKENKDNKSRINLLKEKSNLFLEKFHDSPFIINDEKAHEHFERNFSVFIKYKDTSFIFPHTFIKFIELEELYKTPYLDKIADYFHSIKKNQKITLHLFLTSIFYYLQQIHIKLSSLEFEVLKLLTDNNFMLYFYSNDNNELIFRTYSPTYLEIYEALKDNLIKCSKRSIQKIKTDLFNYQICYDRRVFINYAKLGFIYVFVENLIEIPQKLSIFCLWEIQNGIYSDVILCIPFGNIDSLLEKKSYEILDQFFFDVNIAQYKPNKEWLDIEIPFNYLFLEESDSKNLDINKWDIQPLQGPSLKIDTLDLEILDNLVKSNLSNYRAIDRLSQKITKNHIEKRMQKLASAGIFRFFSQVNLLGIDFSLRLKIRIINDQAKKENIIKMLSYFPEVMIFSNKEFIITYIRVPRNTISSLMENINLFNLLYKSEGKNIFLYSNDYYNIKNSIYILDIILYENGIATLKNENSKN